MLHPDQSCTFDDLNHRSDGSTAKLSSPSYFIALLHDAFFFHTVNTYGSGPCLMNRHSHVRSASIWRPGR